VDCIEYALSEVKGFDIASFDMAYRNQMTGELGYTRQEGYKLWDIFAEQAIRQFGPTHEEEKAIRESCKSHIRMTLINFHSNSRIGMLKQKLLKLRPQNGSETNDRIRV